jgi:hypothetical protein
MLGGKYEDFLFNMFGHGQDITLDWRSNVFAIEKICVHKWGEKCVERGESGPYGKVGAIKKNGNVWSKGVGYHNLGHANEPKWS